jgi:hypothetical protein
MLKAFHINIFYKDTHESISTMNGERIPKIFNMVVKGKHPKKRLRSRSQQQLRGHVTQKERT